MEWFQRITPDTRKDFEAFRLLNHFSDTAFSLLYAWSELPDYRYRVVEDSIVVCGRGIKSEHECFILRKPGAPIDPAADMILQFSRSFSAEPVFAMISEEEITEYRDYAERKHLTPVFDSYDGMDDYIYNAADYLSVSGRINKTKRGSLRHFLRQYPDVQYTKPDHADFRKIHAHFRKWCTSHYCRDCLCGCEHVAFQRFLEVYDENVHIIRYAESQEKLLSFFIGEMISPDTLCCYFQKNIYHIRGLTYWLSRTVMEEFSDIRFLNLCEDMGIKRLMTDKSGLHPCKKLKKCYMIVR